MSELEHTNNLSGKFDPKVYIGGLRSDANKYDIEDAFSEYGKVNMFSASGCVSSVVDPDPHVIRIFEPLDLDLHLDLHQNLFFDFYQV